jgi:hypothetical protein
MSRKKREDAIRKLVELAAKGVAEVSPLSRMELDIEGEKRQLGQERMAEKLAALPPENGRPKSCPRCGKNARVRTHNVARTFKSMSGTHTIHRNYHYCEVCKEGFYPRDEFLGLPREGELSAELEKRVADFAVNDAYEVAEERWRFHYGGAALSANQFRQVAKRLGQQAEDSNDELLQGALLHPPLSSSETLYVMNDGGMVPMREGKWSEAKLAVLFRAEDHLSHRQARRGVVSRARYVAVLGHQEEFSEELRAALRVENAIPARRVAWIADGAQGNWSLASMLCPNAIQILDWCHAVEHAMTCARSLFGEEDVALPLWRARAETLLLGGNADGLFAELHECLAAASESQRRPLEELIRYYQGNRERIDYARFLREGLMIASGIVESGHRHVIQARMKKSGQHWGQRGGRQMARLRAALRTAGPERFYNALKWAHRQTLRIASSLPPKRKLDMRRRGLTSR